MLAELAGRHGARVIDLDDAIVRGSVADEPGAFVAGPSPVFVDEYQRVPEILDAIKAELNRDFRPGRFVLTGSTRFDAVPRAAQSLTGRVHFVSILPFSQGELAGVHEDFLDVALTDPVRLMVGPGERASPVSSMQNGCAPVGCPSPSDDR